MKTLLEHIQLCSKDWLVSKEMILNFKVRMPLKNGHTRNIFAVDFNELNL